MPPKLTAEMATALSGSRPTNMVSTMAMLIQPSSARTRGTASRKVGRNSERSVWNASMVEDKRNEFKRSGPKEQTGASGVTIKENVVVSEMRDANGEKLLRTCLDMASASSSLRRDRRF